MTILSSLSLPKDTALLTAVPLDAQALALAALKNTEDKKTQPIIFIGRDGGAIQDLKDLLSFYAPQIDVLLFPAWDTQPYDRASPHRAIMATRLETLARLAGGHFQGIVLTTASALLQRVAPPSFFKKTALHFSKGGSISSDALTHALQTNGFERVDTVRMPGDYALRGGIIDLFPPQSETPYRLDLFGDQIEKIRSFDPVTQRSLDEVNSFSLMPVREFLYRKEDQDHFRNGFRQIFGRDAMQDPLYEAVSAGRLWPGLEQYLPLFFEKMATLFDYMPDTILTYDDDLESAVSHRFEQIQDYYGARQFDQKGSKGNNKEIRAQYYPLPPEQLYLTLAEWEDYFAKNKKLQFSTFHQATGHDFTARSLTFTRGDKPYDQAVSWIKAEQKKGQSILLTAYSEGSLDRILHVLDEHGLPRDQITPARADDWQKGRIHSALLPHEKGFRLGDLSVLTESDILGERLQKRRRGKAQIQDVLTSWQELASGDYVAHIEHGVAQYAGLETLTIDGSPHDFLKLLFADNDRLYVPVENIDSIARYGNDQSGAALDRLGSAHWQAKKARVKKDLLAIAGALIDIAAKRAEAKGEVIYPPQSYEEFCAGFPYVETEDQARAIQDVLKDLSSGRPMDRLVCGDVGFGKTEVALRAAFVAAMAGITAVVIAPTTLLAQQHYERFAERTAKFPLRVKLLSRFTKPAEAKLIKKELSEGKVDIMIGTHALLNPNIKIPRLGMIIIDEEQHFGVKQKEHLKELQSKAHILTLTATPIPRTLQLSLVGIKELSLIATPPVDRLAVRSFVTPYDPVMLRDALLREFHRGGQSFFVAPFIEDLEKLEEHLKELVPEIRFRVAHGQMPTAQLEKTMAAFCRHEFDLLLSTSIVESGLDIPNANTMIIWRADRFGLGQLYQLRGRVGRSKQRAYAYLTFEPEKTLTENAARRLEVMQSLDQLGAGFTLASHDLDIRGAGNILGEEQSGHIREIGVELYQQMLEEAIEETRYRRDPDNQEMRAMTQDWAPQIQAGLPILIPETYVQDLDLRMGLYRRLGQAHDEEARDLLVAEFIDRFGPIPDEVHNLIAVIQLKELCRAAFILRVEIGAKGIAMQFHPDFPFATEKLIAFIATQAGTAKLTPDFQLVLKRSWPKETRLKQLQNLLKDLLKFLKA